MCMPRGWASPSSSNRTPHVSTGILHLIPKAPHRRGTLHLIPKAPHRRGTLHLIPKAPHRHGTLHLVPKPPRRRRRRARDRHLAPQLSEPPGSLRWQAQGRRSRMRWDHSPRQARRHCQRELRRRAAAHLQQLPSYLHVRPPRLRRWRRTRRTPRAAGRARRLRRMAPWTGTLHRKHRAPRPRATPSQAVSLRNARRAPLHGRGPGDGRSTLTTRASRGSRSWRLANGRGLQTRTPGRG